MLLWVWVCVFCQEEHIIQQSQTERKREKSDRDHFITREPIENIIILKTIIGPSTVLSERIVAASQITLPDWFPPSSCWQSTSPLSLNDALSCGLCLGSGTKSCSVLFLCYIGYSKNFILNAWTGYHQIICSSIKINGFRNNVLKTFF